MPTAMIVTARDAYPTLAGLKLGNWNNLMATRTAGAPMQPGGNALSQAAAQGGSANVQAQPGGATATKQMGSPLMAFLGIAILLAVIWLLAHKFGAKAGGGEADFANIKLSAVNIMVIALVAVVGIVVLKFFATQAQGKSWGAGWSQLLMSV